MSDPVSTMSTLITNISSVVTAAIGWVGDFITCITASGHELLLLAVLLPFVGLGLGLLKRLLSVRA